MAENHDSPPTLASLRLGLRGKRSPRPQQTTLGLLFAEPAVAPSSTPAPIAVAKPATVAREAPEALRVWTVRALVSEIRREVESAHTDLWVTGEISNLRPAPSGQLYFTLKDGEAQLPAVLFRRQAQLLRFRPKDGDEVRVRGRLSVYETRGQLQLIAETLELRGAGLLLQAFEQLRERLKEEGLFEAARKRPLPAFPKCIGVITSTNGAVIRDIVTVARRRHGKVNLLVYNATMQGVNCSSTVIEGIKWFNHHQERADLILIARGGGSAEDLAGFNDEALARAIVASTLPVVSAIGHETDFTIADFVADLRAPTPSAAAEMITAAQHQVEDRLEQITRRAVRAIRYALMHSRQRYAHLSAESVLNRLRDTVSRREQRIDDLRFRLESASARHLRGKRQRLAGLEARLRQQDIRLRLAEASRRLGIARDRLTQVSGRIITVRQNRLYRADARLQALSPLAVLNRGYALVYSPQGTLLRDATEAVQGQPIRARLASGSVRATVTEILPQ